MNSVDLVLVLVVLVCLVLVLYFTIFKKNKYIFRVRLLTGTKKLIVDDKAVEWRDEKKVKYLKLKKFKELVPMPPQDAIELDRRGRKIVEAYRDERGNYAYVIDKGLNGFSQPIETNQRIIIADQTIKAHSKKTGIMQHLPMIVGLSFVVVLVLGGMLLIGEPLKSLQKYTGSVVGGINEGLEIQESILDKLISLENDVQVIKAQSGVGSAENPPD